MAEKGRMDIPTPDGVLVAFSRRLFRLSRDLEALARTARTYLGRDALTAIWASQRELYLTALSVLPTPPESPGIPDRF